VTDGRLKRLKDPYESPGKGEEGKSNKHEDEVHRTFLSGGFKTTVAKRVWK
jgi:hypothetical protein